MHFCFTIACKRQCDPLDKVVCGTNGVTYANNCEMNKAADCLGQDIRKAYRAECEPEPRKGMCT